MAHRGCTPAEVERAMALWQEFLATSVRVTDHPPLLSGTVESWCAPLHYLVAPLSGIVLTQKAVGDLYHTSASTLSSRVKLLTTHTDQGALIASFPPATKRRHRAGQIRPQRGVATDVLIKAQKRARATPPPDLDDSTWISIFQETHRLLSHLYSDRTHVEILRYLSHVELNLSLAGYTVEWESIRDQFGKLFSHLGLWPAKGRDSRKFVYLQDVFGMREPFVLLTLGYEDG